MMRLKQIFLLAGLALIVSNPPAVTAQGKGGGKGQGGGKGHGDGGQVQGKGHGAGKQNGNEAAKGQGKGKRGGNGIVQSPRNYGNASAARATGKGNTVGVAGREKAKGAKANFVRHVSPGTMPQSVRQFATSRRPQDLIMAAAVSHAFARGHGDDFRFVQVGNRLRLANRNGQPLLFLDENSARDLGRWRVGVVDDNVREGSPSFCRSGAGHPVWGREWCIEKGFGLGSYEDFRWGRTTNVGDIVFAPGNYGNSLVGDALMGLLGTSAFNRLALHAVTLGLLEPLMGRWVSQPTGPQLLMVNSGTYPVAEVVDVNRDNRADDLLVALRPWY